MSEPQSQLMASAPVRARVENGEVFVEVFNNKREPRWVQRSRLRTLLHSNQRFCVRSL